MELIYFDGCPHVEQARAALDAALRGRRDVVFAERDLESGGVHDAHRWPSPTVLVNGTPVGDVAEAGPGSLACHAAGAPEAARIRAALDDAADQGGTS